jgi:NAD-dependent dihydropyrimidine dehydrogenase PreA subunit
LKILRKIVEINEDLCNGCGLCIPACHEGAIEIVDGKAKLLAEKLCDGLGDCLGECPQGAIQIIERQADEFCEEAVQERLKELNSPQPFGGGCPGSQPQFFGCPGSMARSLTNDNNSDEDVENKSALRQWPVQLSLVPTKAPYFEKADLLFAADCVPIAYPNFHQKLLRGKAVAIACPKLDDVEPYIYKLAEIIKNNDIQSITIARMEVPCCGGLNMIVREALQLAAIDIPIIEEIITIQG